LSDKRQNLIRMLERLPDVLQSFFVPSFASLSSTIYKDVVTEEIYPDYEAQLAIHQCPQVIRNFCFTFRCTKYFS